MGFDFSGIDTATAEGSTPGLADGDYLLKLTSIKESKGFEGDGPSYVPEVMVLETADEENHPVGTARATPINRINSSKPFDKQNALFTLRHFLAACLAHLGLTVDPDSTDPDPDESDPKKKSTWASLAADGLKDNMFKGCEFRVNVETRHTKKSKALMEQNRPEAEVNKCKFRLYTFSAK